MPTQATLVAFAQRRAHSAGGARALEGGNLLLQRGHERLAFAIDQQPDDLAFAANVSGGDLESVPAAFEARHALCQGQHGVVRVDHIFERPDALKRQRQQKCRRDPKQAGKRQLAAPIDGPLRTFCSLHPGPASAQSRRRGGGSASANAGQRSIDLCHQLAQVQRLDQVGGKAGGVSRFNGVFRRVGAGGDD